MKSCEPRAARVEYALYPFQGRVLTTLLPRLLFIALSAIQGIDFVSNKPLAIYKITAAKILSVKCIISKSIKPN